VSFGNQTGVVGFNDIIDFGANNGTTYPFYVPTGAFGTPGVYSVNSVNGDTGTLTVGPEPTTTLLALSGLVLWGLRGLRNKRPTAA